MCTYTHWFEIIPHEMDPGTDYVGSMHRKGAGAIEGGLTYDAGREKGAKL